MVQHETIKVASFLYQKSIVFASKLHHFSELLSVTKCSYDTSTKPEGVSNEDGTDASAETESDSATDTGTFTEDAEGNGMIILDNGNSSGYYMYWNEDHYALSIDIDGDIMTLLEAEWVYNNLG